MNNQISNTNISFDQLAGSSEFLNLVVSNISSCILLLDKDMRLQAFNNALKTIFSNKKDEDLHYIHCGEAIGCAYQVEEAKECGKTSQCGTCELRLAAFDTYLNNQVIYKNGIRRPYFTNDHKKVYKDLQFSTRLFQYKEEKFVMMIIEDITPLKVL